MGLKKQLAGRLPVRHARLQGSKIARIVGGEILYTLEEAIQPQGSNRLQHPAAASGDLESASDLPQLQRRTRQRAKKGAIEIGALHQIYQESLASTLNEIIATLTKEERMLE